MNAPVDCVSHCAVGTSVAPSLITPGDFILVTKDSFYHRLIQFGQSLRFPKNLSKYTHCALVVHENGTLLEADSEGIIYTNIADYEQKEYAYVHIQASSEDRQEAVAFAKSCFSEPYSWIDILSIGFSLVTGMKFSIGMYGQEVCSGLVARSLERTAAIFHKDASHIAPADLARFYNVA